MRVRDTLHRFLFEHTGIRGELVHLDSSFRAVLDRYDYPPPVVALLGQALAASALLSATIKFEGSLILQLQGEGAVRLVVAQCDHQRHLRGLARWEGELPEGGLAALMEGGRLVITIDPGPGRKRYQGVVSLDGVDSLAAALERYFSQSEQLGTRFWLAASGERAAGMLLQRLPEEGAGTRDWEDDWERVEILGATVTDAELLELPAEELLYRLYNEEAVRLFEAEPVSFRCSCSRGRIETTLEQLGEAEVRMILHEHGAVKVACEFCNQRYVFDRVDVGRLFVEGFHPEVPQTRQ
ncbi:Hsp33 family molecular chaperone HslO [Endothiovibrio diazotrophicus]